MSQVVFDQIDPFDTNGEELAILLENFKDALMSGLIGPTRPTETEPGGFWIDNALEASPNFKWIMKLWTGALEIPLFTINVNSGSVVVNTSATELAIFDVAGGGTINSLTSETSVVRITGAGNTVINGVNAAGSSKSVIIHNASSGTVRINSNNAAAPNIESRVVLPDSFLEIPPLYSAEVFNDSVAQRWKLRSTSSGSGTGGSSRSGIHDMAAGVNEINIPFVDAAPNTNYTVDIEFSNSVDDKENLIFFQHQIISRLTTDFTIKLNVAPDTANYKMTWRYSPYA